MTDQTPNGIVVVGSGAFGPVTAISAEGPFKVRFKLRVPFGEFPVQLAFRQARILPAQGIDDLRNTPNGTGSGGC